MGHKSEMKTSNRAVNDIEENEIQLENTTNVNLVHNSDVYSSYTDADDDYYVNMVSEGNDSPNKLVDENWDPKYLFVTLGNSEINIMVDTGIVVIFVTKRVAQEVESHDNSAWWSCQPNSIRLTSFNNSPIQNLGNMYCDIESIGWNGGRVDLIVVSNSHRAIIGRDSFKSFGLRLYQQSSNSEDTNTSLEGKHVLNVQVLDNTKSAITGRFPKLVIRVGKSKCHLANSKFKLHFSVVNQRDGRVPIHIQADVENELKRLIDEGHIKEN